MTFIFGSAFGYIQVTAQYSNAVLLAILPHVSEVAKKVDLPMPLPITVSGVQSFVCSPVKGDPGGAVFLTNGCRFRFHRGFVDSFETPHSYYVLQNPDDIPKFYGQVRMNKTEAVQLARETIMKLGYSLESVFAELEPRVTLPEQIGTNMVPHYKVEWPDPRSGFAAAQIEVNGERKRIEKMQLRSRNLERSPPNLGVELEALPRNHQLPLHKSRLNPAYVYALLPIVLRSVEQYAQKFDLPLTHPLTTNEVKSFLCNDNGGWPHSELELTNGYRFVYRNDQVSGFYSPDNFFASDKRKVVVADFAGKWNMSEPEAIELARKTIARLNYPTNLIHTDIKPEVKKPVMVGKEIIPRYQITWMFPDPETMSSWAVVEIDADKKAVKSVYFDDKSFWNHPPPIDVPIVLPATPATNAATAKPTAKPGLQPKPPPRSVTPFKLPQEKKLR